VDRLRLESGVFLDLLAYLSDMC
jgi:CBS domain-containing protein